MAKALTQAEVYRRGEQIDDWPCDVEGSNESVEHIVLYEGKRYPIITDWDGNVRQPQRVAVPLK